MRVALVYRTGGDFAPEHVHRLVRQIREVGQLTAPILLFTDAHESLFPGLQVVPLLRPLQGWWAKMQLYMPELAGDLLYLDLDTTVLGPLHDIAAVGQLAVFRGNVRKDRGRPFYPGFNSSMMYLTAEARRAAWLEWHAQGGMNCIAKYPGGDDRFLETVPRWRATARFFQDLVPGQVAHYKRDIRKRGGVVPPDARVVVFCKTPRPWDIEELRK